MSSKWRRAADELHLEEEEEGPEDCRNWEPNLLRERFTEEVVMDWLEDPKLATAAADELRNEGRTPAALPSILRGGNNNIGTPNTPIRGARGAQSTPDSGIPTRVL